MNYITLSNGVKMPQLGYGVFQIPSADAESCVTDAISVGYRSIDTLRPLRFHDLRHSCASLLLASGVSMKAIQDWLGHSTFNVTANFYSHLDYQSRVSSAEVIANALGDEA